MRIQSSVRPLLTFKRHFMKETIICICMAKKSAYGTTEACQDVEKGDAESVPGYLHRQLKLKAHLQN